MAVIKDNRGSLLASNLSQYLASAANTAGTPVDTNQLVGIINQFLGQGEQISSDITTITNGIYKKFGANDTVVNRTQVVTSGIWSGDVGQLTNFYTSSTQVNDGSTGRYYLNVYNNDPAGALSSSANVQFSIAYGDYDGNGSPNLNQDQYTQLQTTAVYYQMANVLLDPSLSYFQVYSGSIAGGYNLHEFYAININRACYKERLDAGNISLTLSGSVGTVTLIDDSGGTNENVTTAGRVYNLVSGSLNIGGASSIINSYVDSRSGLGYGLFYPDMGVLILNPTALSGSVDHNLMQASGQTAGQYHQSGSVSGSLKLYDAIKKGANFEARRTENVSTSHYFVRANNREFNYSNNPTFVSGTQGAFLQPTFNTDPQVYITTVGLYNNANELLAVAKTSQPINKSFDKEVAIKVKLDF
jgi:hypothetical protein